MTFISTLLPRFQIKFLGFFPEILSVVGATEKTSKRERSNSNMVRVNEDSTRNVVILTVTKGQTVEIVYEDSQTAHQDVTPDGLPLIVLAAA
jgi:hypothetical protein